MIKVEHKAQGMHGQDYVLIDLYADKVKCLEMNLRIYPTWLTSFVSSSMLEPLCFRLFLTDRPTYQDTCF